MDYMTTKEAASIWGYRTGVYYSIAMPGGSAAPSKWGTPG